MGSYRALMLASVFAVGVAGTSKAADLLPPAPRVEAPVAMAEPDFSGWYIRGDVGIGLGRSVGMRSVPDPMTQGGPGFVPTSYRISDAMFTAAPIIGFGIGYKVNQWFRTDMTFDYRNASFSANDQLVWNNGAVGPGYSATDLRNFYRGNLSTMTVLFNGYLDLGTWYGITPYVGAGIGIAYQRMYGVTDNGFSNVFAGVGAGSSFATSGTYKVSTATGLAWALMAGFSYDVNTRLKLDFGYRYLHTGKVKSSIPNCNAFGPGNQPCNIALETKSAGSHDFRIGLRWMLTDAAPVAPLPAPIVRKY